MVCVIVLYDTEYYSSPAALHKYLDTVWLCMYLAEKQAELNCTHTSFIYALSFVTGAQDFLPEFVEAPRWYSIYGIYPKYLGLVTAMQKAKTWMLHARVSHLPTV